ncbi:hypothetical protein CE91St19_04210 [Odoribacter laneus]|nr:hypothetical protein CE91St19_04210 [Odoribacter laneus]GKI25601.1 hypothetical protein CE91St20_17380 [Odoribacter laneus]
MDELTKNTLRKYQNREKIIKNLHKQIEFTLSIIAWSNIRVKFNRCAGTPVVMNKGYLGLSRSI